MLYFCFKTRRFIRFRPNQLQPCSRKGPIFEAAPFVDVYGLFVVNQFLPVLNFRPKDISIVRKRLSAVCGPFMHLISISYPAIFRSLYKANINSKCNITSILRAVQTERVIRSRIGRFNTRLKCAQIKNSLSYCVNACNLRRSERAIKPTTRKHIDKQTWT